METFEGKFALYQRQLQEELAKSMEENTSRIIDELNRGPHDKIKNEVSVYSCIHSWFTHVYVGTPSHLERNGSSSHLHVSCL